MKTKFGHLTYCTNIHAGENWEHHFGALKENIPSIKNALSPDRPFGIGLRLSNIASLELSDANVLSEFKTWLKNNDCYVFTMNGFPYGGFHHTTVKDLVHQPDWTTQDRVVYTLRLFELLAQLLPAGMEGGISTSPLSYKYWHADEKDAVIAVASATENIIKIIPELIDLKQRTGKSMHVDIEPEPDGLIESGPEFIDWYVTNLLPQGIQYLTTELSCSEAEAEAAIREHICLCYDICHFAVGYEDHAKIINLLKEKNIAIGKIQISAALKASMVALMPEERKHVVDAFRAFNESTYLHQVVALQQGNVLLRYRDLPDALKDSSNLQTREWRSHFHVPLFVNDYGVLKSTQSDIVEVLTLLQTEKFSNHLEVETYTWEVLPAKLKLPLKESIIRELQWVHQTMGL